MPSTPLVSKAFDPSWLFTMMSCILQHLSSTPHRDVDRSDAEHAVLLHCRSPRDWPVCFTFKPLHNHEDLYVDVAIACATGLLIAQQIADETDVGSVE